MHIKCSQKLYIPFHIKIITKKKKRKEKIKKKTFTIVKRVDWPKKGGHTSVYHSNIRCTRKSIFTAKIENAQRVLERFEQMHYFKNKLVFT